MQDTQTMPAVTESAPSSAPVSAPIPAATTANCSLFVGDLKPTVTEALLFEKFNSIGPLVSIRVCRDAVTRRSLGYAYVNFQNPQDAERALEIHNFTDINGQPCRMMWSQRDPSIRRSGVANIFIKNLDPTIDEKTLYDTFSAFGNILSCKIAKEGNVSKGFGFIQYQTQDEADKAIATANNKLLKDRKIYVGLHQNRQKRDNMGVKQSYTNLFVKNLDETVTEDELKAMFEEKSGGKVTSIHIRCDENNHSRGFGFVNMEDHEQAAKALESLNGQTLKGKAIFVGPAQKHDERMKELKKKWELIKEEKQRKYKGVNLYVKTLADNVTDDMLRQAFVPYGQITSAVVMRDDKGASKNYGFVCFTAPAEATKAITEMNGQVLEGKQLLVTLAQPKEERTQQMQMQKASFARPQPPMQPGQMNPAMFAPNPMMYNSAVMNQQRMMFGGPMPRPRWAMNPATGAPAGMPIQAFGAMPMQGRPRQRPMPRPGQQQAYQPRPNGPSAPMTGMPVRRNFQKMPSRTPVHMMQIPGAAPMPHLTAATLANAAPEQRKQMLGEYLFPLVQSINPELAPKLTGMLLEMDNSELLHLIESPEELNNSVQEATKVLNSHMEQQQKAESAEASEVVNK